MSSIASTQTKKCLSIREAATQISVALSTIQTWVESRVLPAWKTVGGHRRILIDAIEVTCLRQQTVVLSAPKVLPVLLLTAEDGFEGLILIGQHAPDLIISDLSMPEMDGFKMIRSLRNQSIATHATIIAVTALSASEIKAQGGLTVYRNRFYDHWSDIWLVGAA